MSQVKYEVWLPKSNEQLESKLNHLFKSRSKHIIIKVVDNLIDTKAFISLLDKLKNRIEAYRNNNSIVILSDNHEDFPDFIPVAPTEEEAIDIIEFEEIERDLLMNE